MSRNNGLMFPPSGQAPPQVVVASPVNDVQMIALVAGSLYNHGLNEPGELVRLALDIIAEAVVQSGSLTALIRAKQQARETEGN